jgi:hypothetical protein
MTIPRRIIQTARTEALPPLERAVQVNLRLLHPNWEYVFFDDATARRFVAVEFPQYLKTFDDFPRAIQRFDFFRYLAVYRMGGFYFDLDVLLHSPLDVLLSGGAVFTFEELTLHRYLRGRYGMDWDLGNFAFGAEPNHPYLGAIIENCVRAQKEPRWNMALLKGIPAPLRPEYTVLCTTGPGLVSRTFAENPGVRERVQVLFPGNVCDEATWHRFGDFGVHLMRGSWRGAGWSALRRKLAWRWESAVRRKLARESLRAGPVRNVGMLRA